MKTIHLRIINDAIELNEFTIIKYLVENSGVDLHYGEDYILRECAEAGILEGVKYCIEHDANIHASDDYALRHASKNNHFDVVKYLVDNGADIHEFRDAALENAIDNENMDMVEYLVDHGACIGNILEYKYKITIDMLLYLVDEFKKRELNEENGD